MADWTASAASCVELEDGNDGVELDIVVRAVVVVERGSEFSKVVETSTALVVGTDVVVAVRLEADELNKLCEF
jgi:hypothetical protein